MEDRAVYEAGGKKKPTTFRELRDWLDWLRPDQLDAPALVAIGAAYVVVSEIAAVDHEGGYIRCEGPVLLTQDCQRGQSSTDDPFALSKGRW